MKATSLLLILMVLVSCRSYPKTYQSPYEVQSIKDKLNLITFEDLQERFKELTISSNNLPRIMGPEDGSIVSINGNITVMVEESQNEEALIHPWPYELYLLNEDEVGIEIEIRRNFKGAILKQGKVFIEKGPQRGTLTIETSNKIVRNYLLKVLEAKKI